MVEEAPRMLKFACTCTTVLEVPVEQAGTSLQCPQCGRLVDVPTLSDLQAISEDGTYKIDELELRDEPDRLASLHRAFGHKRVDEHGQEIDMRQQFEPEEPVPLIEDDVLEVLDEAEPPPKYDPETGELVRAMPLLQEPVHYDPTTVPMAKAVINYATADTVEGFNPWRIIPELFKFTNAFVMIVIFLVHILLQLMMFPLMIGMWLVIPGFLFMTGALIAHYANVVNDIGPDQKDELPRPGRDLTWHDDLWGPFVNAIVALGVCYGWLFFTPHLPHMTRWAFVGTILVIGTIGFPAIFLTTTTSGTVLNLAPDKILRVIGAMGVTYLVCVGLWLIAAAIYVFGIVGTILSLATLLDPSPPSGSWYSSPPVIIGYPALLIGIVVMHGYCWFLGLMYRKHHESFDWYLQRHHRKVDYVHTKRGYAVAPSATETGPRSAQYPATGSVPKPVIPIPPNQNHA